jgi:hypothetical protein
MPSFIGGQLLAVYYKVPFYRNLSDLRQEVSKNVEKYINLILGQVYGPDCESENNFLCK